VQRMRRVLVGAAVAVGTVTAIGADPAGADVTATVDGTKVVVTATGETTVTFACSAGTVLVSGAPTSPALPCGSLTNAKVTGDAANQTIDGSGLDAAAFTAGPTLNASGGQGADTIIGTKRADSISGGADRDLIVLHASATPDAALDGWGHANGTIDDVRFIGTDGDDTIRLTRALNPFYPYFNSSDRYVGAISWSSNGVTAVTLIPNPSAVDVRSGTGDDHIATDEPLTVTELSADGGAGNDVIDPGSLRALTLDGGTGTNQITGSPNRDTIITRSETDTVDGRGGIDWIVDASPRLGRQTLVPDAGTDSFQLDLDGDLGAVRLRPTGATSTARLTSSLSRSGQRVLGPEISELVLHQTATGGPADGTLFDAVLSPGRWIAFRGQPGGQDLADITVPFGDWTRTDEAGLTVITPDDQGFDGLRSVTLEDLDEISVHGPWTDANEGFVHRVVRDLLNTFIDDAGRAQRTAALADGTATRAGFVDEIMGDDWYRGYDVERTFVKYLRRSADPSGKAYWINAVANGRPLWRFRAQLLGSNEYFTKAGGTNAAYVTKAYNDVLGRNPDPSGQAYWTAKLAAGADRGTVALQFINAAETRRRLVDDQYLRFLDRLPTTAEQNAGSTLLLTATGEQQLIRSLAIGTEYFQRT